jgi:hypothetical protein
MLLSTPNLESARVVPRGPPPKKPREQSKERRAPPLTYAKLLEASQDRLSEFARIGGSPQSLAASRILESPSVFIRWEAEHSCLLRTIAAHGRRAQQTQALLTASLSLVHRKALFDYMRENQIRGLLRHRLVMLFHGHYDYSQSILAEHGRYLRAAASLICTAHIGGALLSSDVFEEPLQRYERLYAEYFQVYCESSMPGWRPAEGSSTSLLLPLLKRQLAQWRAGLYARIQVSARRRAGTALRA